MKCVILANGEYGEMEYYRGHTSDTDLLLCADGGANYAFAMGVIPSIIVGDFDSVRPEVKEYFAKQGVEMRKYPRRKDFTDTQLALSIAYDLGAEEVVLLGTLGKRLDHTLANIFSGLGMVRQGVKIIHYSPECTVYLVGKSLVLKGAQGDLVSVLSLSEEATGVYEEGFEYQVRNVAMNMESPFGISNVLTRESGKISIEKGILAVFHYPQSKAGSNKSGGK